MTHVLEIYSTRYSLVLASADDNILAGCVCARCGGGWIVLTNTWVERGLQTTEGYGRIQIRLGRCNACNARERILPCDVLPGKTNNVENIFTAVAELEQGASVTEVAEAHDVSRAAVCKWAQGAAQRYQDLAVLYRHRAMLAAPQAPQQILLVRFWLFVAEAKKLTGGGTAPPAMATDTQHELRLALGALLAVLDTLGGAMQASRLGARLFRQAVLLFRTLEASTPSFIDFAQPL